MKTHIVPIEGVENFRDLGGYPARQGSTIAMGKFYRAAALHDITPQGKQAFNALGIEYLVDLRSHAEINEHPPVLEGLNSLKYAHLPMLDNLNSTLAAGEWDFPDSMLEMYQSVLEHSKEVFKKMFALFAESQGGVVFHCTAGKDRTGVTTMLLYGLAGVPEHLIAEDYSYSDKILNRVYDEIPPQVPRYVLHTKKEYMEDTLRWLEEAYGGPIGYLRHIGVTEAQLQQICEHMNVPYL